MDPNESTISNDSSECLDRPRKRRWFRFRFGTKTILLVITIIGVVLATIGHRANLQRRSLEWLTELRQHQQTLMLAEYQYDFGGGSQIIASREDSNPPYPNWLINLVGIDYLCAIENVEIVEAYNDGINTQRKIVVDLEPLDGFRSAKELLLGNLVVPNLSPIQNLRNLDSLTLCNTRTQDISAISNLKNLTSLWLTAQSEIEDYEAIATLGNLEHLDLSGSSITNLSLLAELTQLRQLRIEGCNVVDISPLSGLRHLEYVDIQNTLVEDLSPLEQLTELTVVEISGSKVEADEVDRFNSTSTAFVHDYDD